jgi:hypothetical protein
MEILIKICQWAFIVIGVKAILVGSEFNFWYWFKYGDKYWFWYKNRPRFKAR